MARQNHIFTVVPKNEVESQVGWRLPVFDAGGYLVAVDGAALLLLRLWEKTKEATKAT